MIEKQYLLILGIISFWATWLDIIKLKTIYKYFIFLCYIIICIILWIYKFPI